MNPSDPALSVSVFASRGGVPARSGWWGRTTGRVAGAVANVLRCLLVFSPMFVAGVLVGRHAAAHADEDCPPNIGYQPECQYRPFYTPRNPLPAGAPG
jgi:hypothetical protein